METINAKLYTATGAESGTASLPEYMFGAPWNADLVHQVVTGMQANARQNNASTKDRAQVRGGGKKPWRQKGTGRARHGSNRSPIWRGGGITHGPNAKRDFSVKINRKMKIKALFTTLSQKLADEKIIFVNDLSVTEMKTKLAARVMHDLATIPNFATLNTENPNNVLILVPERTMAIARSFRNLPQVTVKETRTVSPLDILKYRYIIIENPTVSVDILSLKTNASEVSTA